MPSQEAHRGRGCLRNLFGKAERTITFLILLAASAVTLPIFSNQLTSNRDSVALSMTPQGFQSLITNKDRVAAFFSTTGCLDCDRMRALWNVQSAKYAGSITFVEIEYGLMTSSIFDQYNVTETPAFILFSKGATVSRYNGSFASPEMMDEFLQTAYATNHAKPLATTEEQTHPPLPESPSSLISMILGLSVFASPCALPLAPAYLAAAFAKGRKNRSTIGLATASALIFSATSILLIGLIFIILGDVFWSALLTGKLVFSFVLVALGLAVLFDINIPSITPKILDIFSGSASSGFARSIGTYSLLFGAFSLTCSLPLTVGAVLNITMGIDVYSMAIRLLSFATGFAAPFAALTLATGVGLNLSQPRLTKVCGIMAKVGGASMIAASFLILITL